MSEGDREPLPVRRKRLRFRAWHRGTKEMDLLMGPFADARLDGLGGPELDQFEDLLLEPEPDVYAWIVGGEPPPSRLEGTVLNQIKAYHVEKHA